VLLWPSAAIRLALNVARLATSLINKFCISMRAKFFAGHREGKLVAPPAGKCAGGGVAGGR